jgi:hypothetical protein
MEKAAIEAILQQAPSIDPALRDRWIVDCVLAGGVRFKTGPTGESAGHIEPGPAWYIVTQAIDHRTLKVGDFVQVVECPLRHNWIYRRDGTLHNLEGSDGAGEYVLLSPTQEGPPTTGSTAQPHQQQPTTTRLGRHPHGERYAKAVQCQNAARRLYLMHRDILGSADRMLEQQLIPNEVFIQMRAVANAVEVLSTNMQTVSRCFQRISHNTPVEQFFSGVHPNPGEPS